MALDINIKALARIPLFSKFEPEALRLIAFAAQPVSFGAGDVVFCCGELSDGGYLMLSGSLRLEPQRGEGGSKTVGPGVLVGVRALLTETRNLSTAIAQENMTALKVSRHLLRRVLEEFPVSAEGMKKAVSKELTQTGVDMDKMRRAISN